MSKYRDQLKRKAICTRCNQPPSKVVPSPVGNASGAKGGMAVMCKECAGKNSFYNWKSGLCR
jgi:RNase P subunit RPR2